MEGDVRFGELRRREAFVVHGPGEFQKLLLHAGTDAFGGEVGRRGFDADPELDDVVQLLCGPAVGNVAGEDVLFDFGRIRDEGAEAGRDVDEV